MNSATTGSMSYQPASSHDSDQFSSGLPEEFNLPSPLPLPSSIADSSALQNSSPSSTSFEQAQTTMLQNSNNSQEGSLARLPPPRHSLSTAAVASTTSSSSSIASSLQHDTSRAHQPAFYTSSFRLSHMYSQQPPCASWATHQFNTFNPFYSPPNRTHFQHLQQSLPTNPCQPIFPIHPSQPIFPTPNHPTFASQPRPQNLNIGLHYNYRDQPDHLHREMSMLHQATLQQQQHVVRQYSASQHGMMMVQSLRSPFQQNYQQIVSSGPVPVSPSHTHGIRVSQGLPPRYSELFPTPPRLPPATPEPTSGLLQAPLPTPPGLLAASTINISGVTPERYLIPDERTIVGVHRPQQSVQPQSRPVDVATVSKQQQASNQTRQARVAGASSSLPVSQPAVTSPGSNIPKPSAPSKAPSIIKPVAIRRLPPPSVFSWPSYSTPQTAVSLSTHASVATSCLTPVHEGERSPIEQIKKTLEDVNISRVATDAPAKYPAADVPSFSGGNVEDIQALQGEIISEGDLDVGEQVVVETDKQVNIFTAKDKKLEEYKSFVSSFKSYRKSLNYSLVDVMQEVGRLYRRRVTLRLITDFEDLVLDKRRYTPLMSILKLWMKDTTKGKNKTIVTLQYHSIVPPHFRKKKARVNILVSRSLEEAFTKKMNPTPSEVKKMAEEWKVEKSFIRSWFCDRRRQERRRHMTTHTTSAQMFDPDLNIMPLQVKGSKIPSLSYDITIEVSSHHPRDQWLTSSPFTICI